MQKTANFEGHLLRFRFSVLRKQVRRRRKKEQEPFMGTLFMFHNGHDSTGKKESIRKGQNLDTNEH